MKPLYIFDLDGTLADLKHRRHFVERPACCIRNMQHMGTRCPACSASGRKPNWDAFHAACVDDTPIEPVISIFKALAVYGCDIWIWSGRSDSVMKQTVDWLREHCRCWLRLKMRDHGDYTPDDVLKRSWYEAMAEEDRGRLVAVFDDRDRVVAMWRSQGVVCLQCAPGDF